ncbi:MAG: NHLP leader peptide family RiPP precursor [Caldilineaceae bacterium]|nr:NHLP leader peptide family RiPP precursor [Caldilineaceae bacterium]MCB0140738.1 NHLP leader peptide family RiPP precursor [Caldilineaceae bacterium]
MSNQSTAYHNIIAKAWADPDYKARLMHDPKSTLQEAGVQIPDNVAVKVVADTDEVVHIVLPASPAGEALSEQDLEKIAAGTINWNTKPTYFVWDC